jgi:hypothetical protein
MTEKELYLAIGLPMVAVLTSLIISLIQVTGIREDMRQMRGEFHSDTGELRREFNDTRKEFTAALADMRKEAREDRLRIDEHIQLLTGKVYEMMGQK